MYPSFVVLLFCIHISTTESKINNTSDTVKRRICRINVVCFYSNKIESKYNTSPFQAELLTVFASRLCYNIIIFYFKINFATLYVDLAVPNVNLKANDFSENSRSILSALSFNVDNT